IGVGVLVLGTAGILHLVRGGVPLGAFTDFGGVFLLVVTGLLLWGDRYLRKHPERLTEAQNRAVSDEPIRRRAWVRRLWITPAVVGVPCIAFGLLTAVTGNVGYLWVTLCAGFAVVVCLLALARERRNAQDAPDIDRLS
ncbi:MAG: hypothetical protein J2P19_22330, partial [Pseudonocardia sp.]|nr:hypothetical protein [Pseudonocardia sp.]